MPGLSGVSADLTRERTPLIEDVIADTMDGVEPSGVEVKKVCSPNCGADWSNRLPNSQLIQDAAPVEAQEEEEDDDEQQQQQGQRRRLAAADATELLVAVTTTKAAVRNGGGESGPLANNDSNTDVVAYLVGQLRTAAADPGDDGLTKKLRTKTGLGDLTVKSTRLTVDAGPHSESPSASPSGSPSISPSESPTKSPTREPSEAPSKSPTRAPSAAPTPIPTTSPSAFPSASPTEAPSRSPTWASDCGMHPRCKAMGFDKGAKCCPSVNMNTGEFEFFSCCDNTEAPTKAPTDADQPTGTPSASPSPSPTKDPTVSPTDAPSAFPSASPTLFIDEGADCFNPENALCKLVVSGPGQMACCPMASGEFNACCAHPPTPSPTITPSASPTAPTAAPTIIVDIDAEEAAVSGSTSLIIMSIIAGLIVFLVFVGMVYLQKHHKPKPVGHANSNTKKFNVHEDHPHAVLARKQAADAVEAGHDIANLAEEIAHAETHEEKRELIHELQMRMSRAMQSAGLAATSAAEAGPRYSRNLQIVPDFKMPGSNASIYEDHPERPRGTMSARLHARAKARISQDDLGREIVRKRTLFAVDGPHAPGGGSDGDDASEHSSAARSTAKGPTSAGQTAAKARGRRPSISAESLSGITVRKNNGALDDARGRRDAAGGYAPSEENKDRAREKFKDAMHRLKGKKMSTGAGLIDQLKKDAKKHKGHGSLKRKDSAVWNKGGDKAKEARKRARRRRESKKKGKHGHRKSHRRSRRRTVTPDGSELEGIDDMVIIEDDEEEEHHDDGSGVHDLI